MTRARPLPLAPSDGWTRHVPAPGVVVHQPARGFRYGSEAFWIAGAAMASRPTHALDLGTGSGIAALLLAGRGVEVIGVDVRAEWRIGWARSLAESDPAIAGRVDLRVADVRGLDLGRRFDVVVGNPPFFAPGSGPAPVDPWVAAARFEDTAGDVAAFVRTGLAHLAPGGRLVIVVPIGREADVRTAGPVRARTLVGRRRVVLELGDGPERADARVDERDAVAAGWYAAVGATLTAPVR